MHFAAIAIHRLRSALTRCLPRAWIVPPVVHDEGIHPLRGSAAEMEIEPGSPASSWVVWEVSARRRRGGEPRTGGAGGPDEGA